MKRKNLSMFIPVLYSDAKTGKIIIDEEIPAKMMATTDAGHSEPLPVLPELRGGELLINPRSGKTYRVHKVANKGRFATTYDEPLYRLENVVIGNQRWTLEELAQAGMKLAE